MSATKVCPACHKETEAAGKFCRHCRHHFADAPESHDVSCPKCAKLTPRQGKFCKHCGGPLSAAGAPSARPPAARTSAKTPPPQPAAKAGPVKVKTTPSVAQPSSDKAAVPGPEKGPEWQAVVGELPPTQQGEQPDLSLLLKAIPGRVIRQLLLRVPAMLFTFLMTWALHTYWLVVSNEGFNGSDHWTSPLINIPINGTLTSLVAFGMTSALGWSVLFSLLRSGPTATLASFVGAPGRCLQALFSKDPHGRLGVAVGLVLTLLGSDFLGLSSQARMILGGSTLFLLMGYPGMLLGLVMAELINALKVRYPWLRSLEVGMMVRGTLASVPVGFLLSWILSSGLSEKLGWLALAFVGYTLYTYYNGGKGGGAANLCLLLGLSWLAQYLLTGHCWADDGGWIEATQYTGESGLTVNNIKTWWNATGSGKSIAQGLGPAMAAAAAAALPPLTDQSKLDPNRVIGYILQLSANQFSLQPKEPAALTVSVWQVAATGAVSLAGGASINLAPPSGVPGLQVQPTSGSGEMQCSILWSGETPAPASATIPVHASAGGTNHSATVQLTLASATIEHEFIDGKSSIKPDGRDSTVLRARVTQGGTPIEEATASLQFVKGNEWLDTSEAIQDGTWRAITVQASDPAGPDSHRQPPTPVSMNLTAMLGDTELSGSAQIQLLPPAELDVDLRPDVVTLIQGDTTPVKFHAILTNPGTEKWEWRLALDKPGFCSVDFQESETPGVIDVTVVAPTSCGEGSSGAQESTKLHIFAEQSGVEPLERILPVVLAREGITVLSRGRDAEGQHVVLCDTTTRKEVDVVVYLKDEQGKLVCNPGLASNLWFEDNCQEQRLRNLLSVARPEIKPEKPMADSSSDLKGYTWTVRSQAYIPGDEGEIFRVAMTARVMGYEDRPEFSCDFDLGLKSMEPDIGSEDWRREKEGCLLAIRFVPEPAKSKLREAIERWAQTLGHEGLKVFRKKIWRIAQDLILAEGAEGYEDEARWADRCLFLAENVKWGSDLVFTAAAGAAFGPVGVIGAPMLKSLIENILVVASERGFDQVDDWFWETVTELEQTLDWATVMKQGALVAGGIVTDPAVLEKILGNSPKQKAAAWAIYVGYTFASNMARGMSMCDAIKQTMRTVRDRVVVQFLMGRMKWNFQMPQALKDAAGRMTGNPPRMTEADMLAIQSDPQLLRSLKGAPANIQQGFLRTYNSTLVAPHDAQLIQHVRSLPEYQGRVVRVETFSTPGKSGGGVGADRDFRVTVQNPDGTWREVPVGLWKDQSARIVGQLSGGRTPQQLNWRATDRFDIEASPDYATQNGQISNVTKVIRGQATLKDPGQFGNMWQQKMSGVEPGHTVPPLENVAQAQKALGALKAVRGGYQKQGYKIGALTPQMEKGAQIVQGANVTATGDYNAVNSALQKAGFKGGFPEFANKVAGQFQALGMARK